MLFQTLLMSALRASSTETIFDEHDLSARDEAVVDVDVHRLAELAVDDLFRSRRLLNDDDLAALRRGGASNQELILATLLAAKTGDERLAADAISRLRQLNSPLAGRLAAVRGNRP